MMKQNRHSLMAKGIMVLLTLLILVFIFTYAWFVNPETPASANGLKLNTSSGADFQMAIGFSSPDTGGEYVITDFTGAGSDSLDFEKLYIPHTITLGSNTITNPRYSSEPDKLFNLLESFRAVDLTGTGVTLHRPVMLPKNKHIDTSVKHMDDSQLVENKQYISFDLYVRSESQGMKIKLDSGSYVLSALEVGDYSIEELKQMIEDNDPDIVIDNSVKNPSKLVYNASTNAFENRLSKYGDFSEDSVVGAVRVAFTEYTDTTNFNTFFGPASGSYGLNAAKSKLWIPRSDIYLQDQASDSESKWILRTSSNTSTWNNNVDFHYDSETGKYEDIMQSVLGTIKYSEAAAQHWYYYVDSQSSNTVSERFHQVENAVTSITSSSDVKIISLSDSMTTTDNGKTYYYGKCRVNLWIEGCDAEARRAIDGGSFFFGFDLSGVSG